MRLSLALILAGGALATAVPASSQAAERAGRVLIAAGDVAIVRDGQRIVAQAGTEVQSGDTVELGSASNAQLLLTDNSIVALRPETAFRIADYRYSGKSAPGERSFLALLKGGMRTLTGVIGHLRRDEYHVTTPTATIGIRGTNYSLVQCDNNCRNADGSLATNGTYGAITDGRISVTNRTGEHVFGSNQFFSVQSPTALPKQLIGPPPFLQDTLQGRGRAKGTVAEAPAAPQGGGGQATGGGGAGSESASTVAQTGLGGGTGDTSVTSATASLPPPVVLLPTVTPTTNAPSVNTLLQAPASGIVFYRFDGSTSIPVTSCSSAPCGTIEAADLTLGVDFTNKRAYLKANFVSVDQNGGGVSFFNLGTPFSSGGMPITVSGGQVSFSATLDRSSFPRENGAFRCLGCADSGMSITPGWLDTMSISGTISGAQANLTLTGSSVTGGGGSFNATLTETALPNSDAAAIVAPANPSTGGAYLAASSAYWGVVVDPSSRMLLAFGAVGEPTAVAGSAVNRISGSAPAYGNLVWGSWTGGGAVVVPYDYSAYTTPASGPGSYVPWITGNVTPVLPASLGTVTFTPIGWELPGNAIANSASLTANFVNRTMSITLDATNTQYGNRFVGIGTSGIGSTSSRFSSAFSSVTCNPCRTLPGPAAGSGNFAGFFAGPNAEGAGLAFIMGGLGTAGTGVAGAVAFKR